MPDRRNFIKTGSAATTALLLSALDLAAAGRPHAVVADNPNPARGGKFDLKIMATNWGFDGSLQSFCAKAKREGYDGIEIWWPMEQKDQGDLFAALRDHELEVGFLCGGYQSDWKTHLDYFKKAIDAAANNTVQRPLYINCHSGKDYFSFEENQAFIDHTQQLSASSGVLVCHETHRSRMLFAAPVARTYLEKNPGLRVTFDVSHWCNVSESLLQDQPATLDLTLQRTEHIHARIGHSEGPQVNDPRAPEWDTAVKAHFAWWDKVVQRKRQNGERLTILTEFGPPDYMPTLPYTRQPLVDQWTINVHMMRLLRSRYQ